MDANQTRLALVTGATGYIGGELVPVLLAAGWRVRVLTRRADSLGGRPWAADVEVVEGSADDESALRRSLAGVRVAYYLIHSMGAGPGFREHDRRLAAAFGEAAAAADVKRIVYLSGLHPAGGELSPHLASRVEVGDALLASGVPTAVLQAAVVLGAGSASFDMLRYLTTRLPAMVAPKWLANRIQPIAIADVLHYLVAAADLPSQVNRTFDIGGPEVLRYSDMIHRFAQLTGLRRRLVITVPVLTPRLAGYWVGLVTPISASVGKPLVGSLIHEVVCQEEDLMRLVGPPMGGPTPFDAAVRTAMTGVTPDTALANLATTVLATAACAVVGSAVTQPGSRWYQSLDRPAWQPPQLAFPIVWSLLYADLALTSAAVLTEAERTGNAAAASAYRSAFAGNLALNATWSALFFGARQPVAAAVECAALAVSSADLARRAWATNPRAGRRLAPYAAWCAFALLLNTEIVRRNPEARGLFRRVSGTLRG